AVKRFRTWAQIRGAEVVIPTLASWNRPEDALICREAVASAILDALSANASGCNFIVCQQELREDLWNAVEKRKGFRLVGEVGRSDISQDFVEFQGTMGGRSHLVVEVGKQASDDSCVVLGIGIGGFDETIRDLQLFESYEQARHMVVAWYKPDMGSR